MNLDMETIVTKNDRMISTKSPVVIESQESIRTLHPEYEKDIVKLEADRRDFIKHEHEIKLHFDYQQEHIDKLEIEVKSYKKKEAVIEERLA